MLSLKRTENMILKLVDHKFIGTSNTNKIITNCFYDTFSVFLGYDHAKVNVNFDLLKNKN